MSDFEGILETSRYIYIFFFFSQLTCFGVVVVVFFSETTSWS